MTPQLDCFGSEKPEVSAETVCKGADSHPHCVTHLPDAGSTKALEGLLAKAAPRVKFLPLAVQPLVALDLDAQTSQFFAKLRTGAFRADFATSVAVTSHEITVLLI